MPTDRAPLPTGEDVARLFPAPADRPQWGHDDLWRCIHDARAPFAALLDAVETLRGERDEAVAEDARRLICGHPHQCRADGPEEPDCQWCEEVRWLTISLENYKSNLSAQVATLEENKINLLDGLKRYEEQVATLEHEGNNLANRLAQTQDEKATLEADFAQRQHILDEALSGIRELNKMNATLEAEKGDLHEYSLALREQIATRTRERDEARLTAHKLGQSDCDRHASGIIIRWRHHEVNPCPWCESREEARQAITREFDALDVAMKRTEEIAHLRRRVEAADALEREAHAWHRSYCPSWEHLPLGKCCKASEVLFTYAATRPAAREEEGST